jgi:hypothetical protein
MLIIRYLIRYDISIFTVETHPALHVEIFSDRLVDQNSFCKLSYNTGKI